MNDSIKRSRIFICICCIGLFLLIGFNAMDVKAFSGESEGTRQIPDCENGDCENSDCENSEYGDGYSYGGDEEEEAEEEPEEIKVKKISFSKKKLSGKVGEKIKLKPVIKPLNATNKKVSYSSSNKKVATVNSKGVVTLKKKGTVTITCKTKDGSNKKAKVKITVKKADKNTVKSKFKARTTAPGMNSKYYFSSGNVYYRYDRYAPTGESFDDNKYCVGNCTWYACGRAWEVLVKAKQDPDLSIFGGNPYGIWLKNKQTKAYKTGKTPKVGALVVFGPKYGSYHIAVVEKIEGDEVYVSESGYKTLTVKPSKSNLVFHYGNINEWNRNRQVIGYIYLIE